MKVFARDRKVVSIDADLASTSGLEGGVGAVDQRRALNVGVAEANMMLIGEAFAALGHNTWVSTFCPFFDWKVLRRIAVGHQERLESIASADGWLSEGHGLDLTFLATAANFETRTNGATHMGNDDSTTFQAVGQLQIIDVSCPQQMLAIMRWIMDGNRGLVYVRVMRTPSAVIYGPDYTFEFGRAAVLREAANDDAVIVSSGRQVHESLVASDRCRERGVSVGVVDMPSVDESLLLRLLGSRKLLVFAEQNDGYLLDQLLKVVYRHRASLGPVALDRVMAVNSLGREDARGSSIRQRTRSSWTPTSLRLSRSPIPSAPGWTVRDDGAEPIHETTGCERRRRRGPGSAGPSSQLADHRRRRRRRALFDVHDPRRARTDGRPAHSHPNGEEAIYIITGSGRVMIDGNGLSGPGRLGGAVSAGQGAHAQELGDRGDEGRLLLCAAVEPGHLQVLRGRRFPGKHVARTCSRVGPMCRGRPGQRV